jgi:hypothetical protein
VVSDSQDRFSDAGRVLSAKMIAYDAVPQLAMILTALRARLIDDLRSFGPFPSRWLRTAASSSRMPYLNSYTPAPPLERADWHAATPLEAYDLNFAFDLPPRSRLETDGVRLKPVIVRCLLRSDTFAAAAAAAG